MMNSMDGILVRYGGTLTPEEQQVLRYPWGPEARHLAEELKKKIKTDTSYWIESDIKTDKDGDTIIILYVGHKGEQEKVQYFIKPEKCQLSSDHKDLDPSKIISKIEVTLKDRSIIQKFDDINK